MDATVPLSSQALDRLWTVFDTDASTRACRAAVEMRLLGEGVSFVDRMYKSIVDAEFDTLVQREYVRFARDVLDSVFVQGFACFYIDKTKFFPYVCPRGSGTYVIGMDKKLKRTISFIPIGKSEPDTSALFVIDEWPDTDGTIRSAVAACQRIAGFRMMVELNTSIADYARARPIVYTETSSASMSGGGNLVFPNMRAARVEAEAQAFTVDGGALASDVIRARTILDEAKTTFQERMLSRANDHQQMLARDLNAGVLDGRDIRIDPSTGLPVFEAETRNAKEFAKRLVPLPIDAKASNAPRPESRGDLVSVLKFCAEQTCIVMGVSPASIGVDVGRLKSDYQHSEAMTWTTVMRFKRLISTALANVYVLLFGPKDDLMVNFPSLMQSYMLRELYEQGLIRREAYIASVSERFSIPAHFFLLEEPREQVAKKKRDRDGDMDDRARDRDEASDDETEKRRRADSKTKHIGEKGGDGSKSDGHAGDRA